MWETIGSHVEEIINSSLSSGVVPAFCKKAVTEPLIKKAGLESTNVSNYRPISKLPFLSKILEKFVFLQLQSFLEVHGILDTFQ